MRARKPAGSIIWRGALQAGVLAVLAGTAALVTYAVHPQAPVLYLQEEPLGDHEVTLAMTEEWDEPFFWIDARASGEYAKGYIAEAISLNESNWDTQMLQHFNQLQENRRTVVYCDQYACKASKVIAEKLRDIGLTEVYVLRDGWKAWKAAQERRQ